MIDDPTTAQPDPRATDADDPGSDEHPLASPTELAGTTEGAIAAEFAARDAEQALDADAAGAMSGSALEADSLDCE